MYMKQHKQHKNDLQAITSDRHNTNDASINVTDNRIINNWMVIEEMLWKETNAMTRNL